MAEQEEVAEQEEGAEQEEEWTHDTMVEALWRTPEKKEISILYERQDKSRYSGQAPEDSREWKDFFHKFTLEQVDQFSETNRLQREIQNKDRGVRVQRGKKEEKQKVERRKAADDLETLFRAKLEAFEIPEVRDSENRELRSRIRKSKSLTEISALVASLITLSIIRVTLSTEGLLDERSSEESSSNTTTIETVADKEIGDET